MSFRKNSDRDFLLETTSKGLFPKAVGERQKAAFLELAMSDLRGKLDATALTGGDIVGGREMDGKLMSRDGVYHEADWVIVVATKVELETCIEYLKARSNNWHTVELGATKLTGRLYEVEFSKGRERSHKKVYLQRTTEQGSNSSSNLVQRICNLLPSPEACFLVGSCGAIPTKKLKLLDVIVPTIAIDGQRFSVENGEITPEPGSSFERHATITNKVAGLVTSDFDFPEVANVETDKQIITSIGKWDSLESNVVSALLNGGENIVAVEMEGVGLVDGTKRSQELSSNVVFGISKGAADYCSTNELNDEQFDHLKATWPESFGTDVKPTSDPVMKLRLQKEAIRRALVVALTILEAITH